MEYEIVYKVVDAEFSLLYIIPFAFIIFGFFMIWYAFKKMRNNPQQKTFLIIFSVVFILFAISLILSEVSEKWANRNRFKDIFENNEYKIAEGEIENLKKLKFRGDYCKTFLVNKAYFECHQAGCFDQEYNSSVFSGQFKENGQKVRLSYIIVKGNNRIIKVEIKQ